MRQQYVLTFMGDDHPGLIDQLAKSINQCQGSWLESRMANLSGKFCGILLVSVPTSESTKFEQTLASLEQQGLSLAVNKASGNYTPDPGAETSVRILNVVAQDRPGILSELSSALAQIQVNVEELVCECVPAPMSSELLFNAKAQITLPDGVTDTDLLEVLEALDDSVMVELEQIHTL